MSLSLLSRSRHVVFNCSIIGRRVCQQSPPRLSLSLLRREWSSTSTTVTSHSVRRLVVGQPLGPASPVLSSGLRGCGSGIIYNSSPRLFSSFIGVDFSERGGSGCGVSSFNSTICNNKNSSFSLPSTLSIISVRQKSSSSHVGNKKDDDHNKHDQHEEEEHEEQHVKDKRVMATMSTGEKFKYLSRRYGRFAILYYLAIGTIDISVYYSLISAGVDVQPFLDTIFSWVGLSADFIHPKFGNLIAAYSLHKVLTVPRVLFVGSTTPYLVSRLKKHYPAIYTLVCK
eukprot:m.33734 g.33734  ORF g.33734 m.33734 type:complete len:284 (+) comp9878_c1_seq2:1666-2517(+)